MTVEGDLSRETAVQGTVLGPVLFLYYINDLPDVVTSTARLFADDCLLYRRVTNDTEKQLIQKDLDPLQQWEHDWQMAFNAPKCETLHVTKQRNPPKRTYTIHGGPLLAVKTAKYLGLYIATNILWNHHIDGVTKRAYSAIGFLRRNIGTCPVKVKKSAYVTFFRPTVEYAASFYPATIKLWKTLPDTIIGAPSTEAFRHVMQKW